MYKVRKFLSRLNKQFFLLTFDAVEFFHLLVPYIKNKFLVLGLRFEFIKRIVVAGLISKRGRFTRPFLHFGVGSFFIFGIIAAPVFATTYPILAQREQLSKAPSPSAVLSSATEGESVFSTQISPKPRDRIIAYVVEEGDTLSSIAQKFDISVDTIAWENNINVKTNLSLGQELRVLPVSGVAHKVIKGDTIYSIAKKYDTEAQGIVNFPFNDFADADTFSLTAGQILIVPDGSPPQVVPSAPRPLPRFIAQSDIIEGVEGFIWPTSGSITQYPVWYHMAVDIANKEAPPVAGARAGKVSTAECVRGGYGCYVILDHGNGIQSLYAHLSQIAVAVGDNISQGQVIGRMGSTGRSTGTHLHFEVRKSGVLLNPLNFLK